MMTDWSLGIGWALGHLIWQACVAGLLFLGVRRWLSPRARYAVGMSLIALLVALVSVNAGRAVSSDGSAAATTTALVAQLEQLTPAGPSAIPFSIVNEAVGQVGRSREDLFVVLGFLWLAVVMVSLARLAGGWVVLRRKARSGAPLPARFRSVVADRLEQLPGQARVLVTDRLEVPAVVGIRRPVVLIPRTLLWRLSPSELEAVVVHELSHLARHDVVANLLQHVAEALLLKHPVVSWLSAHVRRDRELCCDDLAARWLGKRRVLARGLAKVELLRCGAAYPALAASDGDLLVRIRSLLDPSLGAARRRGRWIAAVLMTLAAPLLFLPFLERPPVASEAAVEGQLVLRGRDPVMLVRGEEAVGQPRWSLARDGYRYWFTSRANREAFDRDPERYAVINPEVCPIDGLDVKPSWYRVVDGRIVLFCCSGASQLPEGLIAYTLGR